jgi:hypothetical protein
VNVFGFEMIYSISSLFNSSSHFKTISQLRNFVASTERVIMKKNWKWFELKWL